MRFRSTMLAPLVGLAIGACADQGTPTAPTAPTATLRTVLVPSRDGDRLATVEWEGSTPRLYLQNPDGTDRVRVSFAHVSDHVKGNYSPRQLPVTDESLMRITHAKWSPDGRYLAVIVGPASDALQVVLVSADGRAVRTVSPNGQYLWGSVDWAADASRIAYIMATGPFGRDPDIFVTTLGPDQITRVTTGAKLSGYDALRFDASGTRILFTEHLGWAEDGTNSLSRLASVDLATGAVTRAETVVGEPQGFARDGSWALFIRTASAAPYARELFRLPLGGGEATVLASGPLGGAEVAENEQEAVLSSWSDDGTARYSVIGLTEPDDLRMKLATSPSTVSASLWRAPE
jgi:Tol biopolymer transport system component